jgi:CheY-like chemotaxis protein
MATIPEILLIEDDADDRELFAAALQASGVRATLTCAGDAAEAVLRLNRMGRFAETPLPSLVVLDLGLPGLQGGTLLQVIRNAYGPRSIPVVVLTGSYRSADRTECESWGISDYLIKPNSYPDQVRLVSSLRRWLTPNPDTTPARFQQPPPQPGTGIHAMVRPQPPTGREQR